MDGAITKAPLEGGKTFRNRIDRAKPVTKRHLVTERNGLPVGRSVGGANIMPVPWLKNRGIRGRVPQRNSDFLPTDSAEAPFKNCACRLRYARGSRSSINNSRPRSRTLPKLAENPTENRLVEILIADCSLSATCGDGSAARFVAEEIETLSRTLGG
jgi:hypothetical protein